MASAQEPHPQQTNGQADLQHNQRRPSKPFLRKQLRVNLRGNAKKPKQAKQAEAHSENSRYTGAILSNPSQEDHGKIDQLQEGNLCDSAATLAPGGQEQLLEAKEGLRLNLSIVQPYIQDPAGPSGSVGTSVGSTNSGSSTCTTPLARISIPWPELDEMETPLWPPAA